MKIKKQFKVAIITLVTQRTTKEIQKYFDSVAKIDYRNYELILVINNENPKYAQKIVSLARQYPKVKVVNNKANLGFCIGTNIGLKIALKNKSEFQLLLNDDVIIKESLIKELLLPFKKNQKMGLVSPLIMQYPATNKIWYGGGYMNRLFAFSRTKNINKKIKKGIKSGPIDVICGCCAMAKKEFWQEVGLLDENIFMYYDDQEISLRAHQYGYICYLVARPLVIHLKKSTKLNSFEAYFYARNPFFLIKKYYKGYKKITAILGQFFIRLPRNFLRLENNKTVKQYLRGISDGVRGI